MGACKQRAKRATMSAERKAKLEALPWWSWNPGGQLGALPLGKATGVTHHSRQGLGPCCVVVVGGPVGGPWGGPNGPPSGPGTFLPLVDPQILDLFVGRWRDAL